MENTYMILPSNTSDFPKNTTSEFRVRLQNPLNLEGDWEMAMVEIQYPHSWDNINNDKTRYVIANNEFLVSLKSLNKSPVGLTLKYSIPPGNYDTIHGLIHTVNEVLKTKWNFTVENVAKYNDMNNDIMKESNLEIALKHYRSVFKDKGPYIQLKFSEKFQRVKIAAADETHVKGVFFSPLLQYIFGLSSERWLLLNQSPPYFAKFPPDISASFNTLFVYCNLLEPQIVGNTLAPILRSVPVRGKHGDCVNKVFLDPHYIKLKNKSFDTVEIVIKSDKNEPVKFNFGKSIVKVHLRKVKSS